MVLLLVGAVVLVLRVPIPEPFALAAEFGVGAMLVVLGGMLGVLVRERWHMHTIMTVNDMCTCIVMRCRRITDMYTGGVIPFDRSVSAWPMVWPVRRRCC